MWGKKKKKIFPSRLQLSGEGEGLEAEAAFTLCHPPGADLLNEGGSLALQPAKLAGHNFDLALDWQKYMLHAFSSVFLLRASPITGLYIQRQGEGPGLAFSLG